MADLCRRLKQIDFITNLDLVPAVEQGLVNNCNMIEVKDVVVPLLHWACARLFPFHTNEHKHVLSGSGGRPYKPEWRNHGTAENNPKS